jgi:Lon protease-like protein
VTSTDGDHATLPLFPLTTVLFPGLVLPLHVFEDRYRSLVRSLLQRPTPAERLFGVVAIRHGWEVGENSASVTLYDVGCTAEIREVKQRPDGSFDIVTVGRRRYAISEVLSAGTPYLQAAVDFLPERPGPPGDADSIGPRVLSTFRAYLRVLRQDAADEQLPEDPLVLSHVVAATASLRTEDRQALLAAPDTASRLREELRLLHREIGLLSKVRAVPASLADLGVQPSPN